MERKFIWLNRICYFGFIAHVVATISFISSILLSGVLFQMRFGEIVIASVVTVVLAIGLWSFYKLREKNSKSLLVVLILTFLLILIQLYSSYKIAKSIPWLYIFDDFSFFTQVANFVTTNIVIFWCLWLVQNVLRTHDEREQVEVGTIDTTVYLSARLVAACFIAAALNHLQATNVSGSYQLSISAQGIVLYGFPGWQIWHWVLLVFSILLLVLSFSEEKLAALVSKGLSLLFVLAIPLASYSAITSEMSGGSWSMKFTAIAISIATFSGVATCLYWLADTFLYASNYKKHI